jgi:hypothetical protein
MSCTLALSCKEESTSIHSNGLVLDLGSPSVDGCGWVIKSDDQIFKPKSIPVNFQTDSLPVIITYIKLNTIFQCGFSQVKYNEINLESISKI